MRSYKLVLLLTPDIKKETKEKLFEEIKKWAGKIESIKVDSLGEKKLAYPIKKAKRGEYAVLSFEAEKVDTDLNRRLLIRDEILRHLLVRN